MGPLVAGRSDVLYACDRGLPGAGGTFGAGVSQSIERRLATQRWLRRSCHRGCVRTGVGLGEVVRALLASALVVEIQR
jgi:hypothetical protein